MIRGLIVDDEAPARERLRHLLAGADIEIVGEAADGEEAMAAVERLRPDLLFLDIQMPSLSGLEVAARLPAPKPRIVFCTAYDQFAIDAFEVHAVEYLLKPVNRDRLARAIDRVGGEISEERRRRRENAEAIQTQARLMPDGAPAASGLDCAGACRPAAGVSGDYYDLLPVATGGVAVALADISGKGTYAGLLAAALQARMQAITATGRGGPSAVLSALNRLTVGTIEDNRFATVFFGVVDPAAGRLTYANAGHPPALVVARDGTVRRLEATGPAVGWNASATFEEMAITIAPDDVVAAYSDGLSEAASPDGRELGIDGIVDIVGRHRALPARALVAATLADVDRFCGGVPPTDDRTVVVACVGAR
jgi:serine phosphatase RsbU (regulator of sigma subunit)